MDLKVTSSPYMCENSVRKKNLFIPEGTETQSQKEVEKILSYREPMNVEAGIEKGAFSNSGDCVSFALMRTGSPTVHVQRMRVMSTEINLAIPTSSSGYQIYCPPSNSCFVHEGRNIFIIQEEPELFLTSKICDTDKTSMKPKHTMKSHVLNPEAKEFIPFDFRELQTNCKLPTVEENNPVSNISNKPMEYIIARDELFPCSTVAAEDFKVKISNRSMLPEQVPLIMESTSDDDTLKSACTCSNSSNLNGDEQTNQSSFASGDQDLLMALAECLSLSQEEKSYIGKESLCSKNEGSEDCKSEEKSNSIDENVEDTRNCRDRNHIGDINKQSGKDQNLESDDNNIVFVASDEETENSDDSDDDSDWEDEEENSEEEDETAESSEEEESCDEIEDEENEKVSNESDDDDISICFTVDDTQESDNESDLQGDDTKFEIEDEDNKDEDYACDLFQVEFNDDEVRIPMDGLGHFLADLLSQTANSCTTGGMVDFLNDSDELDVVDSSGFLEEREEILQANKRWNEAIDLNCCSSTPAKVKFSDDVEIYSADDCCRKGPWEMCARDRMRFQRRIEEAESMLSSVLNREHRCKVLNRLQAMEKQ